MTLSLAFLIVTLLTIFTNRIFAVLAGLWFRLPGGIFLPWLILLDALQVPMFYWVYDHGAELLMKLPPRFRQWAEKDRSGSLFGRWGERLGGMGVMLISALPSFGGGVWSATFVAYSLRLRREAGYLWVILGSVLSYLTLYWILGTIVIAIRYFSGH